MRVTLIQMHAIADKLQNFQQVQRLVTKAVSADHPDLIVLPEMFNYLGGNAQQREESAECFGVGKDRSLTYQFLKQLATEHRVAIHGGSCAERCGDAFYNTTLVFNNAGEELARYRKMNLFKIHFPDQASICEAAYYQAGDAITCYALGDLQIGCGICFDLRFPALFQSLVRSGAQVMVLPAAFLAHTGESHWEVLCRARAIETQSYVVAAAQSGHLIHQGDTHAHWGHSMVVDPWGRVCGELGHDAGYLTVDLDACLIDQTRERYPLTQA